MGKLDSVRLVFGVALLLSGLVQAGCAAEADVYQVEDLVPGEAVSGKVQVVGVPTGEPVRRSDGTYSFLLATDVEDEDGILVVADPDAVADVRPRYFIGQQVMVSGRFDGTVLKGEYVFAPKGPYPSSPDE